MKPDLKTILIIVLILLSFALFALRNSLPSVQRAKCVGCGDCSQVCPTQSITIQRGKAVIDQNTCINCNICVRTCTYRAIEAAPAEN